MNKQGLLIAFKDGIGLTKSEAKAAVNPFFNKMSNAFANGDRVKIRGLCSFYVKKYKVFTGRNPKTGEQVKINPNVAKVGGLQSQGAKGEAVVNLLRTLGNAGSGVLRLSRRVNNMASNSHYPLNSSRVRNQKGKCLYDFYLKIE